MIGLNPWNLKEDKFCILWLESDDCQLEEALNKRSCIKKAKINRLFALKVFFDSDSDKGYVAGKWEHHMGAMNGSLLTEFMCFVDDSYIVGYKGNKFLFPMINENLLTKDLIKLNERKLLDIEEILGWVEDEKLVSKAIEELNSINKKSEHISDRVALLSDFFIDRILPVLKNGIQKNS